MVCHIYHIRRDDPSLVGGHLRLAERSSETGEMIRRFFIMVKMICQNVRRMMPMKKKGVMVWVLMGMLMILSGLTLADNKHTVTVRVEKFAKLTVLGPADIATTIQPNEIRDDGTVSKNFNAKVKLQIRTNSPNGCSLSVAGQPTQGSNITSLLQVGMDENFNDTSKYTTLTPGGSPIVGAGLTKAQTQHPIELTWRVNGDVSNLDPSQSYVTTVTYTVVAK